jgi:aldehyde dehydrogenase (NAD+)
MANELRDKKDLLGSLVSLEMGKIKAEGDGEVQEMIDIADFSVGLSRQLYGLTMHSERFEHSMYEQWHPLGNVGIISAFNFPHIAAINAFQAHTATGNISIWKPSPKTPLCGIAIQNICGKVISDFNLPNIFNLINDQTNSLSQKLIDDRRIDLLSFTGSSFVGRKVGNDVSARMGKYLLELGGNNAIIVDQTANLDIAIPGIVFGSVGTAGQRCTTTRRVLVHTTLTRRFLISSIKVVCTRTLLVVVHRCPAVPTEPKTMPGIAMSRFAV